MRTKGFFGNRLPPRTVLTGVQQVEMFLNLIREKNALVLTGKLEESDELDRGKKHFEQAKLDNPNKGTLDPLDGLKHSLHAIEGSLQNLRTKCP